nr:RolB family protein [Agrobacterium fabrum]
MIKAAPDPNLSNRLGTIPVAYSSDSILIDKNSQQSQAMPNLAPTVAHLYTISMLHAQELKRINSLPYRKNTTSMGYTRPVFPMIDLFDVSDHALAKVALIGAKAEYREFVEKTLASAQKSWVASLRYHDDPDGAVGEILARFAKSPCLHGPRLEPFDTIFTDRPLLYVYGPREKIIQYARNAIVSVHATIGLVACSVAPYDEGVTYQSLRYRHNQISPGSCLFEDALEAYIAFFPSRSFLKLPYSLLEVHRGYVHKYFALQPGHRFWCEVIAVGLTFPPTGTERPGDKPTLANKRPRGRLSWCIS